MLKPGRLISFCRNCFAEAGWKVTVLSLLLLPLLVFWLGGGRQEQQAFTAPRIERAIITTALDSVQCGRELDVLATTCSAKTYTKTRSKTEHQPKDSSCPPSQQFDESSASSCALPALAKKFSNKQENNRQIATRFTLCVTMGECTMELSQ
jgi:hypothetical protein